MPNHHLPIGILRKLTRQRKDRSLRQFRPVVLGMEPRIVMAMMTPMTLRVGPTETYTTIQSAIDAADPGDTIDVDSGVYAEQLTIDKSLTIQPTNPSDPAPILSFPTASTLVGIAVDSSTPSGDPVAVSFSGFDVEGGGAAAMGTGFSVAAGASATISGNTINGFGTGIDIASAATTTTMISGNMLGTTATGANTTGIEVDRGTVSVLGNMITGGSVGVVVASSSTDAPASVTVGDGIAGDSNTITGYTRAGINASGAGTSAMVLGNTITGLGSNATAAQYGIAISNGALATIGATSGPGNDIADNQFTSNSGVASAGILLDQAASGTTVVANTITGNAVGIQTSSTNPTVILGNAISGYSSANSTTSVGMTGIEVDAGAVTIGDGTDAGRNIIGGYMRNGILVSGSTATATIDDNVITGIGSGATAGSFGIYVNGGALGQVSNNTISNNQTPNTNSVGIYFNGSADRSYADSNTLDNNDIGISVGSTGATDVSGNRINTNGGTGRYGIGTSSTAADDGTGGTTTISNNTIDAVSVNGINSNATGTTTITGGTINDTSDTYAGIEVDQGTVDATSVTINGGQRGIYVASVSAPATVNLAGTTAAPATISGAGIGLLIDSSRGGGAATVNVQDANTTTDLNAHGVVFQGSVSFLNPAVAPHLAVGTATYTQNSDGSYDVSIPFTESDNITSANDLVSTYSVDGGAGQPTPASPLMLTLPQGNHTVVFTVMNQSTGANKTTTMSVQLADGVSDGGFESPSVAAQPGGFVYNPAAQADPTMPGYNPWTFSPSSGLSGTNSAFTSGNPAPPQGSQVAFLQSGDGTTGQGGSFFTQSVTFQTTGMETLSFSAAQRGNFGVQSEDFAVYVGGKLVGKFLPSGSTYRSFTTNPFAVTAGQAQDVTFVGIDSAQGDNTAFIDNIVAAVSQASATPTVADGGFEAPSVAGQPGGFSYNTPNPFWSFSGGTGIAANGSNFTGGQAAPEGSQVAFLQQGDGTMTGTSGNASYFSQSVTFGGGGNYVLTFSAAQRGGQAEDFAVYAGTKMIGIFQPSGPGYQSFTTSSFTVPAGGGTVTITFVGRDTATGDNTAFIDDVQLAVAPTTTTPTVADGGFEAPSVAGQPGGFSYNTPNPFWSFSGGTGIAANGSNFTGGQAAPEGSQVAFLQGGDKLTDAGGSYFSQSVTFGGGGNYVLTFSAAQRGGQAEDFDVYADGNLIGTFQPSGPGYQSFTTGSFTVPAGGGTVMITFVGRDSVGGDNTAFIDDVQLAVAPAVTAPTVADGSFEAPALGNGQFAYAGDSRLAGANDPWTFVGGSGISANNSGFTSGQPAPDGSQVAFLQQGDGTTTASGSYFSQNNVTFTDGGMFQLNFSAAQRTNNGPSDESVEVYLVDNADPTTKVGDATFTPGSGYSPFSTAFTAVAGDTYTIYFVGLNDNNTNGGDNTAFIDNVTITTAS